MKNLSLLLVLLTTTAYSQSKRPLKDLFYLESDLSHAKSYVKTNQAFIDGLSDTYADIIPRHEKYQQTVKQFDEMTARIKEIPEKKRNKQEKAFIKMNRCVDGMYKDEKAQYTSMSHCMYSSNVDPRLFRKTADGKILGEAKEIQEKGDELSKFVNTLDAETPTQDEHRRFSQLKGSLEHKEHLEKVVFKRMQAEIQQMELNIAERKAIDKRVNEELMGCKNEIQIEQKAFEKMSANGSLELAKDLLTSITQENISNMSFLSAAVPTPCQVFEHLRFNGYCLDKKPKEKSDCVNCNAKLAESRSEKLAKDLSDVVNKKNKDEDCSGKNAVTKKLGIVYCDVGMTNDIKFEADHSKKVKTLRRLVATHLAQGLPVGKKQNQVYGSVIGMKDEGGTCKYLVRDLVKGESSWVLETSILEGLEEINHLMRR